MENTMRRRKKTPYSHPPNPKGRIPVAEGVTVEEAVEDEVCDPGPGVGGVGPPHPPPAPRKYRRPPIYKYVTWNELVLFRI